MSQLSVDITRSAIGHGHVNRQPFVPSVLAHVPVVLISYRERTLPTHMTKATAAAITARVPMASRPTAAPTKLVDAGAGVSDVVLDAMLGVVLDVVVGLVDPVRFPVRMKFPQLILLWSGSCTTRLRLPRKAAVPG